jgi:FkbM family methyltransferase
VTNHLQPRNRIWLDENNAVTRAKRGWFLANKHDSFLGTALLHYGEALEMEHRFLISIITPRDRVIEVGSNIGIHTVGMCKAALEVIAIEPQPSVFRILCGNLALNDVQNVRAHNVGCGATRGTLTFKPYDTRAPHNSGGVSLFEGIGQQVPVVPLDEIAADFDSIKLIKIDVETMELEVLRGAEKTLAKHRPLLYVENEMQSHCEPLVAWLREHEYGLFWHTPVLYNPKNAYGAPNIYGDGKTIVVSYNMLCMPLEYPTVIDGPLYPVTDAFHNNQAIMEVQE